MRTVNRMGARARTAVIAFLFLAGGVTARAGDKARMAVLQDFDESGAGFRFSDGSLVRPGADAALFETIDLLFDMPHGLGTNNPAIAPFFRGQGGIVDAGARPLSAVKEAPAGGYLAGIKPDAILEGHTYCLRTADGRHYAKLHVVRFDREKETLEFSWQYQAQPTNAFEEVRK